MGSCGFGCVGVVEGGFSLEMVDIVRLGGRGACKGKKECN